MSRLDRRQALKLFGGIGVAGFAAACGGSADAADPVEQLYDDPVRVGLLVPASGGNRQIGDEIRNGFRHYLQAHRDRLGGHPVIEEEADEGESPSEATEAIEALLSRNVHAIVGVAGSPAMLTVAGLAEEANVPLLGTNASPRDLLGFTYIWRTSFVNHDPGRAMGNHLAAQGNGRVALVAQADSTGRDAVIGVQDAFGAARVSQRLAEPIYTDLGTQPDADDFDDTLAEIRSLDADAVFAAYAGTAATEFVRQYLDAGMNPERLYGPAYLTEGETLTELGRAAVGIHTTANYAPELRSGTNRGFTVDYREAHGSAPTVYAVAAYDGAAALDMALRLTGGDPSARGINNALGRIGLIDSPRGRWQFNQSRTPTQKWYLRQVAADGPVIANMIVRELGTIG